MSAAMRSDAVATDVALVARHDGDPVDTTVDRVASALGIRNP
jgi:hypothetical protein